MNYELRITNYERLIVKILFVLVLLGGYCLAVQAQSTNQNFPTAVTSSEISGSIKARDLGDARLTSYFYIFNAAQGDVFINVLSNNLNGNVDVFTADGLKPLTKIVVFADGSDSETGRVVYLRKPEKLILRVEGRPPNDERATFRIKFAGSFQALSEAEQTNAPAEPKVSSSIDSDVRVNSVGTIIAVKPKPTPMKETIAEIKEGEKSVADENKIVEEKTADSKNVVQQISIETDSEKSVIADSEVADKNQRKIEVEESGNKIAVVVTDNAALKEEKPSEKVENGNETERAEPEIEKPAKVKKASKATKNTSVVSSKNAARDARIAKAAELNAALENIRLVILMKNGEKIEKPMSEILRVGVDKGVLTVIAKDGTINRYSILEIARMTIE